MIHLRPPLYLLGSVLLMLLLDMFEPIMAFDPLTLTGWSLIAVSILTIVWIGKRFSKHNTPIRPEQMPEHLMTDGPYRFSRNPIYVLMVLALVGVAFILGSMSAFLGPILFIIVIDRVVVPHEEKNLGSAFGDAYDRYCGSVRRWV